LRCSDHLTTLDTSRRACDRIPNPKPQHKIGLFLLLVAAGISFSLKPVQSNDWHSSAGLAATWLLGTISVRLLWLLSSLLVCLVGILVAGKPVVDDGSHFASRSRVTTRCSRPPRAVTKSRPLYVVKSEPLPPALTKVRRENQPLITMPWQRNMAQSRQRRTNRLVQLRWNQTRGQLRCRTKNGSNAKYHHVQTTWLSTLPRWILRSERSSVHGFRREMCIGSIADNGDCHTVGPPWAVGLQPNCVLWSSDKRRGQVSRLGCF